LGDVKSSQTFNMDYSWAPLSLALVYVILVSLERGWVVGVLSAGLLLAAYGLYRGVYWVTLRLVNVVFVPLLWWDTTREFLEWLLEASPGLEFLAPDAADEQAWCADHPRLMRDVAGVSVTSGVAGTRLRRRARWVRALQKDLGGRYGVVGEVLRGRWEPDLPSVYGSDVLRYVAASVENGVRILGGGFADSGPPEGEEETREQFLRRREKCFYLLVATEEGDDVVFPHLLGHLRQHSLFRQRDSALLLGLRSRAVEWCRARGLVSWVADLAVASAVSFAMELSTHESLTAPRVEAAMEASPLLSG
jgi:hypothetical protein